MYKLLLCWRYLRTRYIALASIISVTLGVATMIVVNSVMEGFTTEMQGRIHGILSDVVFESHSLEGFPDAEWHMSRIREVAGPYIAGMTPTVAIPGMLSFEVNGRPHTRQVTFIGVDERTHGEVSDFNRYMQHPDNRKGLSFNLREDGYDAFDHDPAGEQRQRNRMELAGWQHRRSWARFQKDMQAREALQPPGVKAGAASAVEAAEAAAPPPEELDYEGWKYTRGEQIAVDIATTETTSASEAPKTNPFKRPGSGKQFDSETDQHTGIVVGMALASYRTPDGSDQFYLLPGDDVKIIIPTAGTPPKPESDTFTIVDFYESKMSEYDANFIFVPIAKLQKMRGMIDPKSGAAFVTSIQIKLHNDAEGNIVRDLLRKEFPPAEYGVSTWRDKQGPLLAAVTMETSILNVLLFLIIAVAGFGILAIFYMIVVEKTKDIGILKSLGAPSSGIMGIFLSYGLLLGILGSGAGMALGLLFVAYINEIADGLAWVTGQEIFDPTIYYFQDIPTIVEPFTVTWIVIGAMLIAVMASVMPARRAARMHPVEALRHE